MEYKEHRRISKRHPIQWKAAVIFDKADGIPVLHTQTLDLSANGASIYSSYDDLTGLTVTLLLDHQAQFDREVPKTLKIRAHVVSTVQSPDLSSYRHGLSFAQTDDNNLAVLAEILGTPASALPCGKIIPIALSDPPPFTQPTLPTPAGGGRLAQLKRLALEKQIAEKAQDPRQEINAKLSEALKMTYLYLKEFADHLNILKPPYAKGYSIAGVPIFDDLKWEDGKVDSRTRELSYKTTIYEMVTLNFRLSANKLIRVTRESPENEKLNQLLLDTKIEFTTHEERNERGFVVKTMFVLPCEVQARLKMIGNFDTGKLLLKTRNIERFGMMDQILDPEAISDESLDELAAFILGESMHLGPLLLRNACN